jgi:outer membrane protein OmpA-like peptidoglycan-associated protein
MIRLAAALVLLALAACEQPPPLPPPAAAVPDRRIILTINFDFNSHRIRPESYPLLNNVAIALNDERLRGVRFEINGHTDITGRFGYNIGLSLLRAGTVMDYLIVHGVPADVLRPQGFGPLQLLDPTNPASPVNRRVEIVAIGP